MPVDDQNTNEAPAQPARNAKRAARKRASKRHSPRARRASKGSPVARARSLARGYGRTATSLARRGKQLVDGAYDWVDEARTAVPRLTRGVHLPSPRAIESFAEANPVLLGAVGLGIGVVIGALLPRDAFHTGMQSFGLTGAPAASRTTRTGRKARTKK
jgi:hypothetical protein